MSNETYSKVIETIVASLEKGVRPWIKDWNSQGNGAFPIRSNGKRYRGINVLILWQAQAENGYKHNQWLTFKQAQELGGNVRRGEHGEHIVYFKPLLIKETDQVTGLETEKKIPLLKAYVVFNIDQIDNLPERFYKKTEPRQITEKARDEVAEKAISDCVSRFGLSVSFGGDRAFYRSSEDAIRLPEFDDFHSSEGYYATYLHELGHSTGHKTRLDRKLGNGFGTADYAYEELIAELTAAFCTVSIGISSEPAENHASYLESWLGAIKKDPKYLFHAASAASKASDLILNIVDAPEEV